MRRTGAALLTVGLLVGGVAGAGPAAASGGGGCGADLTEGVGTTVAIRRFCFTPTVLHVRPGSEVTFVNEDGVPHNVLGANGAWGSFETLRRGASATYPFEDAGTFSYTCLWHPGMVGTIVVGNGAAGESGTEAISGTPVASITERPAEPEGGISGWQVATAITASLLVLILGAAAAQGRHLRERR